jgi:hypothetical protein
MEKIIMFKNISIVLITAMLGFYSLLSFAISPGAGQAQMQNNMQEMQQNKQRKEQMRKNRQMQSPQQNMRGTQYPQGTQQQGMQQQRMQTPQGQAPQEMRSQYGTQSSQGM